LARPSTLSEKLGLAVLLKNVFVTIDVVIQRKLMLLKVILCTLSIVYCLTVRVEVRIRQGDGPFALTHNPRTVLNASMKKGKVDFKNGEVTLEQDFQLRQRVGHGDPMQIFD
jgi:hypothetical protein